MQKLIPARPVEIKFWSLLVPESFTFDPLSEAFCIFCSISRTLKTQNSFLHRQRKVCGRFFVLCRKVYLIFEKSFSQTFFNFVIFTIFTWFLLPKRQRKSCAQQKCEIVKRPLHLCRTSHFRQNFVKIFPLLLLAIFRENQVEFVKSVLLQNCSVSLAQRVCKIWYNSPSWLSRNFHKTGKKPNFFRLSAEAAVF